MKLAQRIVGRELSTIVLGCPVVFCIFCYEKYVKCIANENNIFLSKFLFTIFVHFTSEVMLFHSEVAAEHFKT